MFASMAEIRAVYWCTVVYSHVHTYNDSSADRKLLCCVGILPQFSIPIPELHSVQCPFPQEKRESHIAVPNAHLYRILWFTFKLRFVCYYVSSYYTTKLINLDVSTSLRGFHVYVFVRVSLFRVFPF